MAGWKMRTTRSTFAYDLLSPALFLLTIGSFLYGQSGTTGSIFGTVSDKSGAVLANAKVTATNASTGVKRTAVANSIGYYQMVFLPPGRVRGGHQRTRLLQV